MTLFEAFEFLKNNPKKVLVNKHFDEEIMICKGAHFTIQRFDSSREKFYGGLPIYMNSRTLESEWTESEKTLKEITSDLIKEHC